MGYVQGSNFYTQTFTHEFREKKWSKRLNVCLNCDRKQCPNIDGEKVGKKKLKLLVAGGGIGGLVFALAAKSSGFDVKVFEKDWTAVRGEGTRRGPIQLLSSALELLEAIDKDAAGAVMEAGHVTGDKDNGIVDGRTGEWLVKLDLLTPAVEKRIPVTRVICRMELQRILLDAVGDDVVINNSKVVDFVSDANKVTAFLENGQEHEGDILVGADGIRSMVRSKLFGSAREPKYSNFTCYTAIVDVHLLDAPQFGCKVFVGTNQYFVVLNIGKGRVQWYAFVRELRGSPVPCPGTKKMLVERFVGWCNKVITLIGSTVEHTILRRPIHDIDMMSKWGRGRVILLGDAAHAMLPVLGQGGSMAIEDCYWLMLELQNLAKKHPTSHIPLEELESAFTRFEKRRMHRVRPVHAVCRVASTMTSLYHTYIDIPFFKTPSMRLKHPAFLIATKFMHLAVPRFMDWIVADQE